MCVWGGGGGRWGVGGGSCDPEEKFRHFHCQNLAVLASIYCVIDALGKLAPIGLFLQHICLASLVHVTIYTLAPDERLLLCTLAPQKKRAKV